MIKPNYKKAEILARKFLKDSKVKGFPLDLDFLEKYIIRHIIQDYV